jgi:hypothetical protein
MSHEFIDAEHGIGVSFFLVIAQPGRRAPEPHTTFSLPFGKKRRLPRHPRPEVSQGTVRETGSSCPESGNSPSPVAPDYWRKRRFHEHRRRLRAASFSRTIRDLAKATRLGRLYGRRHASDGTEFPRWNILIQPKEVIWIIVRLNRYHTVPSFLISLGHGSCSSPLIKFM